MNNDVIILKVQFILFYKIEQSALFTRLDTLNTQIHCLTESVDLIDFFTAHQQLQQLYKVSRELQPANIQKLFIKREGCYNLRGSGKLKVPAVIVTRKSMYEKDVFCIMYCIYKMHNWRPQQKYKKCLVPLVLLFIQFLCT